MRARFLMALLCLGLGACVHVDREPPRTNVVVTPAPAPPPPSVVCPNGAPTC